MSSQTYGTIIAKTKDEAVVVWDSGGYRSVLTAARRLVTADEGNTWTEVVTPDAAKAWTKALESLQVGQRVGREIHLDLQAASYETRVVSIHSREDLSKLLLDCVDHMNWMYTCGKGNYDPDWETLFRFSADGVLLLEFATNGVLSDELFNKIKCLPREVKLFVKGPSLDKDWYDVIIRVTDEQPTGPAERESQGNVVEQINALSKQYTSYRDKREYKADRLLLNDAGTIVWYVDGDTEARTASFSANYLPAILQMIQQWPPKGLLFGAVRSALMFAVREGFLSANEHEASAPLTNVPESEWLSILERVWHMENDSNTIDATAEDGLTDTDDPTKALVLNQRPDDTPIQV